MLVERLALDELMLNILQIKMGVFINDLPDLSQTML